MHRGGVNGVGADGSRPRDEQRDGIVLAHGRQVELAFTGDPERLAARCHDPKSRRGGEQVGERPGGPGQQLLEVVEDDMGSLLADPRRDRGGTCPGGGQTLGDQLHDQRGLANGSKRYEDRSTICLLAQESGKFDRKPCLPRAARANDRHQAWVVIEPEGGGLEQLALASEKPRRWSRQVDCAERLAAGETPGRRAGTAVPERRSP